MQLVGGSVLVDDGWSDLLCKTDCITLYIIHDSPLFYYMLYYRVVVLYYVENGLSNRWDLSGIDAAS